MTHTPDEPEETNPHIAEMEAQHRALNLIDGCTVHPDGRGLYAPQLGNSFAKGHRARVFVLDSSPLIQIREAVVGMEKKAKKAEESGTVFEPPFDPFAILDHLASREHSTLVIPHTVFKEIQYTHRPPPGQHFGLSRTKNGSIELMIDPKRFNDYKGARYFSHWLKEKQDQGELRCYDSIDTMLQAGEFDHAQGGIVIVDDPSMPGYQPITKSGQYPPLAEKNLGESAIIAMAEKIHQHYTQPGDPCRGVGYSIIGTDHALRRSINNLGLQHPGERVPKSFSTKILITALCRSNMFNPELEVNMMEWLCRKNDAVRYPPDANGRADKSQEPDTIDENVLHERIHTPSHLERVNTLMRYFTFPTVSRDTVPQR